MHRTNMLTMYWKREVGFCCPTFVFTSFELTAYVPYEDPLFSPAAGCMIFSIICDRKIDNNCATTKRAP